VLLTADGVAKVADVGAAALMDAEYVSTHFGTLAWAAPELLMADNTTRLDAKVGPCMILVSASSEPFGSLLTLAAGLVPAAACVVMWPARLQVHCRAPQPCRRRPAASETARMLQPHWALSGNRCSAFLWCCGGRLHRHGHGTPIQREAAPHLLTSGAACSLARN